MPGGNANFRTTESSRTSNRPPSGHGEQDCSFDWLMIPNSRGNLTRMGKSLYNYSLKGTII